MYMLLYSYWKPGHIYVLSCMGCYDWIHIGDQILQILYFSGDQAIVQIDGTKKITRDMLLYTLIDKSEILMCSYYVMKQNNECDSGEKNIKPNIEAQY